MTLDAFDKLKDGILNLDPVYWIEKNLTIDGKPFKLTNNGYKPFVDIYRYLGIKALEKTGKPVVICKGRQIGATVLMAALECFFMASGNFGTNGRPAMRVMHAFPQLDLVSSYSKTKLNAMIDNARVDGIVKPGAKPLKNVVKSKLDTSAAANDSMGFKQFQNGNHLFIESLGLDGNRTMGKTADLIGFDEIQAAKWDAVSKTEKILTASQYGPKGKGVRLYFGTPLQSGSEFHKIWNKSSQQYYHLGCEKCGEHFPLYTPGSNEWETIWIHGQTVRCPHCSTDQDRIQALERGKWIAANKNEDCDFIGFHISQLYIPFFDKKKILDEKPENHPTNSERVYQNEVLGEFYSGSSAPLTNEMIDRYCADRERKFAQFIKSNDNKTVVLGVDWGEKVDADLARVGEDRKTGGQSYSCVVVCTVDGPDLLSVQFAKRLAKNDPESKRAEIEEIYRRYNISLAVADIGHGQDIGYNLSQTYSNFICSRAVSSINGRVRYDKDVFPEEVKFERDYWIEEFIEFTKKGKVRFPYGQYDSVAWLVNHFCANDLKVSIDRYGQAKGRYVKGSTPNDGFMATLNAYIAMRHLQSKGFSVRNANQYTGVQPEKETYALLAHAPRMNPLKR